MLASSVFFRFHQHHEQEKIKYQKPVIGQRHGKRIFYQQKLVNGEQQKTRHTKIKQKP